MKKPVNIVAGLVTAATLLLSASAAIAHTVIDRHGDYRPHRHAQAQHAAPVRPAHRYDHHDRHARHDYRQDRRAAPPRAQRDRDGDGVPNRFDARPDNPRRY